MTFLSQILGTVIAFATVMLAASLLVMSFVRIIQYLANQRGKTLGEMLGALLQGYRLSHRDAFSPGDDEQTNFQVDVLTAPILHMPDALELRSRASAEQVEADRKRLARRVDYINKEDLIEIVRRLCGAALPRASDEKGRALAAAADEELEISPRWYRSLPPEARRLPAFLAYIDYWFRTVEGVSSERFKLSARRLTATVSCIAVVALHIDAFQLASNIYRSAAVQEELGRRAADLIETAERMGVEGGSPYTSDREQLLSSATENLRQLNGILNEPDLGLGWQNSRIARSWCAARGTCAQVSSRPEPALWTAIALSLLGLAASGVLLSLGAPFWLEQLKNVLRLQNSIARLKPSPAARPGGKPIT